MKKLLVAVGVASVLLATSTPALAGQVKPYSDPEKEDVFQAWCTNIKCQKMPERGQRRFFNKEVWGKGERSHTRLLECCLITKEKP